MTYSLQRLAEEEIDRCELFLEQAEKQGNKLKTRPRMQLRQFVQRGLRMHEHLIDRWDGPEFYGPLIQGDEDGADNTERAGELFAIWSTFIHDLYKLPEWTEQKWYLNAPVYESGGLGGSFTLPSPLFYKTLQRQNYYRTSPGGGRGCMNFTPDIDHKFALGSFKGGHRGGVRNLDGTIRVGQRWSSAILDALQDYGVDEKAPAIYKRWEQLFQQLGEQIWTVRKQQTAVTLSVRPSDFLQLGHFGEANSCYRNGGESDHAKLFLAVDVPDSLVVLTFRQNKDVKDVLSAQRREAKGPGGLPALPQGRGWALTAPKIGAFVTNFYNLTKAQVQDALNQALEEALGIKALKEVQTVAQKQDASGSLSSLIQIGQMYFNADGAYWIGHNGELVKEFKDYLYQIGTYSSTYGAYSRKGTGPVPGGKAEMPACWPYKEMDLSKAIEKGALYL